MAYTQHEPCPRCGSKDNLARYEDGSGWCFGCHYYEPAQGIARLKSTLQSTQLQSKWDNLSLPEDASYRLSEEHLEWLSKYSITKHEIIRYRMMSSKEKGLILPIFNQQNELLFYVNRPFKEGQPKSKDNGTKATVGFLSRSRCMVDSVVVVEDYISAICVSRVCDCYPLFGSHVSPKLTTMLSKKYDHLVIWLDRDKAKESLRQAARYRPYFKSVRSIMTDLDPKEYNNEQIKEFLK